MGYAERPSRARKTLQSIFDEVCVHAPHLRRFTLLTTHSHHASVRERLKEVLRQYKLRESHFECVVRSKELEVLLSRARAAEQKQLADAEKARADKTDDEVRTRPSTLCLLMLFTLCDAPQIKALRKELDEATEQQTILINKLLSCCHEVRFPLSTHTPHTLTCVFPGTARQRANTTVPTIPTRCATQQRHTQVCACGRGQGE